MSAVDHLLHFRQAADGQIPSDCIGRFLCTKLSWRGKYRRVLCITTTCVTTHYPDSLLTTNRWDFVSDADIDGVSVPSSSAEEQEFVLSARQDNKVCTTLVLDRVRMCMCSWLGCKLSYLDACRASSSPSSSHANNAVPWSQCCIQPWLQVPCMVPVQWWRRCWGE